MREFSAQSTNKKIIITQIKVNYLGKIGGREADPGRELKLKEQKQDNNNLVEESKEINKMRLKKLGQKIFMVQRFISLFSFCIFGFFIAVYFIIICPNVKVICVNFHFNMLGFRLFKVKVTFCFCPRPPFSQFLLNSLGYTVKMLILAQLRNSQIKTLNISWLTTDKNKSQRLEIVKLIFVFLKVVKLC